MEAIRKNIIHRKQNNHNERTSPQYTQQVKID
jgi:hypothetical protein